MKPAGIDHEAAVTERTELLGMLRGVADDLVREHREARAAAEGPQHGDRDGVADRELYARCAWRSSRTSARRCWPRAKRPFSASVLTGALETLDADQIAWSCAGGAARGVSRGIRCMCGTRRTVADRWAPHDVVEAVGHGITSS